MDDGQPEKRIKLDYTERATKDKQSVIKNAVDFVLNPKAGQPSDLRGVSELFGVPYSTLRDNYFKAQGKTRLKPKPEDGPSGSQEISSPSVYPQLSDPPQLITQPPTHTQPALTKAQALKKLLVQDTPMESTASNESLETQTKQILPVVNKPPEPAHSYTPKIQIATSTIDNNIFSTAPPTNQISDDSSTDSDDD
jgi:hypothetical protein